MASEKEYCVITDLAIVRSARAVLRDLAPECGHEHVKADEYQAVMETIAKWEKRLVIERGGQDD